MVGPLQHLSITHLDYLIDVIKDSLEESPSSASEKKEALSWKICMSYEYVGKDIEVAKKFFDMKPIQSTTDGISKWCVKSINAMENQSGILASLLFDCKPMHFITIKLRKPLSSTNFSANFPHSHTEEVKVAVKEFLAFVQSALGVPPMVLAFGSKCTERVLASAY